MPGWPVFVVGVVAGVPGFDPGTFAKSLKPGKLKPGALKPGALKPLALKPLALKPDVVSTLKFGV